MAKESDMPREYIFLHPSSLEHYTAKAVIVTCFDFRFSGAFWEFLKSLDIRPYDLVSVAGGALNVDVLLDWDQVGISIKLHHASTALFFSHADCGFLGGRVHFSGDPDKEFVYHADNHREMRAIIHEKYPDMEVRTFFMDEGGIMETTHL